MEKEEQPSSLDLDTLFPPAVKVALGPNISVDLYPMDLGTCAKFARIAKPILEQVAASEGSSNLLGGALMAIIDHAEEFVEAMAIASGKEPAFIRRLPPASASQLLMYVVAVNSDFFSQSVASLASGAKATTQENAGNGAGRIH